MNTKHTPGPWQARQVAPQSQFSKFYVWQIVGNKTEIAADLVCTLPDYSKDNASNARLIAAAPELLEACQNARNVLAALATGDLKEIKPDSHALGLLRASILKATGGQE